MTTQYEAAEVVFDGPAVSVRSNPAYEENRPRDIEELPAHETRGPVVLEVDLARVPVSALGEVGAAVAMVAACAASGNKLDVERDGTRLVYREFLTAAEEARRLLVAQQEYDRGADAYDKVAGGGALDLSFESYRLDRFIKATGLVDPRVTR